MPNNNDLCDQIKREIQIIDYAQRLGLTPKKLGRWYTLREHDSVRINPEENNFYRYSNATYGSIIDFVMEFQGLSQIEAIHELRKEISVDEKSRSPTKKPKKELSKKETEELPKKPFEPPPKYTDNKRVYGYLCTTRGIDKEIVKNFIDREMLYEGLVTDKTKTFTYHNACFLGYDYDKTAKYGFNKSIGNIKFAGDMESSEKKTGIYVDNKSKSVVISEAIIDAMSVMTISKLNGGDYLAHNYLSMQGQNVESVKYHLTHPENAHISQVVLAVDNDKAGDKYREKISSVLEEIGFKGKVFDRRPTGKDFNDDLLEIYKKKEMEAEFE